MEHNTTFYAGYIKDFNIRVKSSSGGIFYALASKILNNNGVVFGCRYDSNWMPEIAYIEDLSQIDGFMGSKYAMARIGSVYDDCKNFLESGRLVLFTALPCQIHGLRNYLKRDYQNLICVDICCHGVPVPGLWENYVSNLKKRGEIKSICLRDKITGWRNYSCSIFYTNEDVISSEFKHNEYMQKFLSDKYLRSCCYDCRYKNEYSAADIMIGDLWGIWNCEKCPDDYNDGVSLIMCPTKKGEEFILSLTSIVLFLIEMSDIFITANGGLRNKIWRK